MSDLQPSPPTTLLLSSTLPTPKGTEVGEAIPDDVQESSQAVGRLPSGRAACRLLCSGKPAGLPIPTPRSLTLPGSGRGRWVGLEVVTACWITAWDKPSLCHLLRVRLEAGPSSSPSPHSLHHRSQQPLCQWAQGAQAGFLTAGLRGNPF